MYKALKNNYDAHTSSQNKSYLHTKALRLLRKLFSRQSKLIMKYYPKEEVLNLKA